MNTTITTFKLDNSKKTVFSYNNNSMRTRATVYRVDSFTENGYSTKMCFTEKEAREYLDAMQRNI